MARFTEHDDAITPLLRWAPRLGVALGAALAKAGRVYRCFGAYEAGTVVYGKWCFD